jgi:phenylacetate-CoA ligase
VIAISETLNDYTKNSIRKNFNTSIVSRYSNLENGIIAQQEISGSEKYLINTASYIVEILQLDNDKQGEPGETGRIVITDLFNFGMPLIRYDTGDIGTLYQDSKMPNNMYLEKIEGRKLDMLFDTRGNIVSSYIMYKNMWQYTDIIQYQLIQEDEKTYTFKINADKNFNNLDKIIKEFKIYLGQDAVIVPEYVSEIPLLSSGKRKIIVNNYVKNDSSKLSE